MPGLIYPYILVALFPILLIRRRRSLMILLTVWCVGATLISVWTLGVAFYTQTSETSDWYIWQQWANTLIGFLFGAALPGGFILPRSLGCDDAKPMKLSRALVYSFLVFVLVTPLAYDLWIFYIQLTNGAVVNPLAAILMLIMLLFASPYGIMTAIQFLIIFPLTIMIIRRWVIPDHGVIT
jgi:hypothetical protein